MPAVGGGRQGDVILATTARSRKGIATGRRLAHGAAAETYQDHDSTAQPDSDVPSEPRLRVARGHRAVIVGGGFGGLSAARALRRADVDVLKSLEGALDICSRILRAFEAAELERDPEARRRRLTFVDSDLHLPPATGSFARGTA